jgi:hypothetical protein
MKIPHVSDDEDALAAFPDGRGVFDVDLHCRKLDAFVAEHKMDANIYSEDLLRCAPIPRLQTTSISIGCGGENVRW